jgi:hypothetical protein
MLQNPFSTSLRFPFACLANKRRKLAITLFILVEGSTVFCNLYRAAVIGVRPGARSFETTKRGYAGS